MCKFILKFYIKMDVTQNKESRKFSKKEWGYVQHYNLRYAVKLCLAATYT